MAHASLGDYLERCGVHLTRVLPNLSSYKKHARNVVKEQLLQLLQAFPTLALRISDIPTDGTNQGPLTARLLLVEGTMPISFQGTTYNIPVSFRLPAGFPSLPPLCYVTPTGQLALKESHKAMDISGRCQVVGFRQGEWDPQRSNLWHLAAAVQRVFCLDPPLYAKQKQSPPPTYILPPALAEAMAGRGLEWRPLEQLHAMALALVSQDAAIEDALEEAGEELKGEGLSAEVYLKTGCGIEMAEHFCHLDQNLWGGGFGRFRSQRVRQLARNQFFGRAKLAKVAWALGSSEEKNRVIEGQQRQLAAAGRNSQSADRTAAGRKLAKRQAEERKVAEMRLVVEEKKREEEERVREMEFRVEEEMKREGARLRLEVLRREEMEARREREKREATERMAEEKVREEERVMQRERERRELEWRRRAEEQKEEERKLWEEAKRKREEELRRKVEGREGVEGGTVGSKGADVDSHERKRKEEWGRRWRREEEERERRRREEVGRWREEEKKVAEDKERIEEQKEMESLVRMREAEEERAWRLATQMEEERREKERRLWEEVKEEREKERWEAEYVALKQEKRRQREERIAMELESLQLGMGCQSAPAHNVGEGSDTGEEEGVNCSTSFLFSSVGDVSNSGSDRFGTQQKGGSSFLLLEPCAESLSVHTYGFTWGQQDSPHLS